MLMKSLFIISLAVLVIADTEVVTFKYASSNLIDAEVLSSDAKYPKRYTYGLSSDVFCDKYRLVGYQEGDLLRAKICYPAGVSGIVSYNGNLIHTANQRKSRYNRGWQIRNLL